MKQFFERLLPQIKTFFARRVVQVFSITLMVHIAAVIFFAIADISLLSNTSDHIFYFESGKQITDLMRQGTYHLGDVYPHHWYPLFLGIVFRIVGASMVLATLINAFAVATSAALFYRILRASDVSKKISFWGALIVMNGYASLMYHSSILLKESLIIMLLLGMLYLGIRFIQGTMNRWAAGISILVCFTLLRSLRFFIGFAAITGILAGWFLLARTTLRKKLLGGMLMIVAVLGIAFVLDGRMIIGSQTLFDFLNIDVLHTTRNSFTNAGGADATATNVEIFKPVVIPSTPEVSEVSEISEVSEVSENTEPAYTFSVGGYVKSLITTILGPFPGQVSTKKYVALLIDTLFVYAVIGIVLWGIFRGSRKEFKVVLPWVIMAAIMYGAIAMGTDNIGAIVRQRIPALVVMGLVACYCVHYVWNSLKTILKKD